MKTEARPRVRIDELRAALEETLSRYFGRSRRIERLRRRHSTYSSSCAIENLSVQLDGGQRLRMVLKDLSPDSLLRTAQRVRPRFLYEAQREIETYEKVLHPHRLGTPTFYGATKSPERQRYWLFLERVTGPLLWQIGRMESWRQAARWLARLHNEFDTAGEAHGAGRLGHLLRYDRQFFSIWLIRAEEFLRQQGAGADRDTRRRFARLTGRYDRVIDRLTELPATFIHGEFYPSNVIMRETKRGRTICPIDWEVAAVAPGLIDLAALTSGAWTDEEKKSMTSAYHEALEPSNGRQLSLAELREAVEYCRLHICVQLLGWAAEWSPPEQHARNWLREALQSAGRLGL